MFKDISRQTIAIFLGLALLFPLFNIAKVFYLPHCLAFDLNDDANLTFINLGQWRKIISQGQWPMMNVYNNFGTPLIGDTTTYPLSPLSLTYAFLPGPQAMTFNRVLVEFITLFLLFVFYRRRFTPLLSVILGLSCFYAPGILWHTNHHHFQLSLGLLTAFFLLQEEFARRRSAALYMGMCVLSIVMFLSISLNVTVILCGLILGYQIFLSGSLKDKNLWYLVSVLALGALAVFPDTMLFLQAASRSMRRMAEYPVAKNFGPSKIFYTPIVAAIIYCGVLFREKSYKMANVFFWLGVIPFGIVVLSRTAPLIWKNIPLLGATDVVRLTWGAGIFVMWAFGGLISRWFVAARGWRWQIFVCLAALAADAYWLPFRDDWKFGCELMLTIVYAAGCLLFFLAWKNEKFSRWMAWFTGSFVVAFYLYYGFFDVLGYSFPDVCHAMDRGSFSPDGSEQFLFPEELKLIPKNVRVAYNFNTILGLDLRGASEGLFGAGARSTIMTNMDFSLGLFDQKLIEFDNYTGDYHFAPPWQADVLRKLGISYVAEKGIDTRLLSQGWKKEWIATNGFLYKNPLPTGVVYLQNGNEIRPVDFTVQGNGLDIKLPTDIQGTQKLVITLLNIPGWNAMIDARSAAFLEDGSKFLELSVSSSDHLVRVRYEPIPGITIILFIVAALALGWVFARRLK